MVFLLCGFFGNAQQALDFGVGSSISVGLQEEWSVNLRGGYEYDRWNFVGEYDLFFRRDVTTQNTETYTGIGVSGNYRILEISAINVFGGFGYTGNNFPMDKRNPNTTNIWVSSGDFNHGFELKFIGVLPLGKLQLFSAMNFKSFGRRYDTFTFGLLYSIPQGG